MFSNVVRMRASSFSSVKAGRGLERRGSKAFKEVVGAALVVLRPIPTTRL